MKEELITLIDNFKNLKVLVVGDAILDTYVKGNPDRVSREAPVLVYNVEEQNHQCGGAANTAINVASLGAETYFLTVLGKDANARELIEVLKNDKVHTEHIIKDKARTTVAKKRITAASNILMRIDEGTTSEISEECQEELLEKITAILPGMDAIILSDNGLGIFTSSLINGIKEITTNQPKPVVVDAKHPQKFKLLAPDAVKPNYEEVVKLLNVEKTFQNRAKQIQEYVNELHELTGSKKVAVTLDAEGVLFFEEGKAPHRISCVPQDNKNAIGAGDTFISAIALSLASGAGGQAAAEIAAAAAAVVVKKDGTVGCTNNELKSYFNAVPKYILKTEDLVALVKDLKKKGRKIVFTNGCFDILHKGHITILNKAREAGGVLIVGVNSDASIKKLKGPDRPINNLEDRITVLAGLQSVDYLISFEDESPVQLIKAVQPDVFVKGGNYSEQTIPERQLLKKIGTVVQIFPYKEEHATTQMINKIRDANHYNNLELQDREVNAPEFLEI